MLWSPKLLQSMCQMRISLSSPNFLLIYSHCLTLNCPNIHPHIICRQRPTPEEVSEGYKLARTATKLMFKRHYVMNRDLTRKAKLKWAAISALPTEEMQRDALLIDPYIPFNVRVARITPPLSGFHTPEEKERERLIADAAAAAGTKQVETVTVQATPTRTIGTKRTTTRRTGANAEVSLGAFLPPRKEPVDVKPSAPPAAPAPFNPFPGKKGKK